jgi:hypothetical protein
MTSREWTMLVWGLLGTAVLVCLVTSALSNGRFPTLGAVTGRITANRAGRVLLVLGWMWLGWHAFAR